MKHFPDEAWLDFVRCLLNPEKSSSMQAHLDAGCERCARLHRLWAAVAELARRESDYMPDESAVTAAKGAYDASSWLTAPPEQSSFLAPVFDSFLELGLPAGVRAISTNARHLLYQSGPLAIDLRIEARGETMSIAGQILHSEGDAAAGGGWDVTLIRGGAVTSHALTNDFGEFCFEAGSGPELRIRVEREGQKPFTLTLPQ
jgi:hypothetical protein